MTINGKHYSRQRSAGFTLIEIVIVVVVAAILASLAYGGYSNTMQKARRAEAITLLFNIAEREERYHAEHGVFTPELTRLGFSVDQALPTEGGYYVVSVATPTNQTFTATATRAGAQAGDTRCGDLVLNHAGVRSTTNSSGSEPADSCWE